MKQPIPELDIGDPFVHFAKQAYRNANRFGVPSEFIDESIAIVRGAFGDDWLQSQFDKSEKELPVLLLRRHPLMECFTIAGEEQIKEVMELAVYLKHLSKVKNVDYVIAQMRDKYHSGLLQLAYAYRFLKLGAADLTLEPPSSRGRKSDIRFELLNMPILVECYIPKAKENNSSLELHHSVGPIADALKGKQGAYRVCIRLKSSIDAKDRKRIERAVISMVHALGDPEQMEKSDESADILIEPVADGADEVDFPQGSGPWRMYGGADWSAHFGYCTRQEIQETRNGLDRRYKMGSRLFVWRPPGEKGEPSLEQRVERLERKISRKLSQANPRDKATKRILIISVEEGKHENYDHLRVCNELHPRILRRHSNVFLVILTARVWTTENDYRYPAISLCGPGENSILSLALVKELSALEQRHDILGDWR